MLSIVSGSNGLWDYLMFAAHVRDHGYDLVLDPPVTYHAVWEKFPELLLIEAKFMAQLHDELFHLVDANELRYSVSGLHTASSYQEQCVVGYMVCLRCGSMRLMVTCIHATRFVGVSRSRSRASSRK